MIYLFGNPLWAAAYLVTPESASIPLALHVAPAHSPVLGPAHGLAQVFSRMLEAAFVSCWRGGVERTVCVLREGTELVLSVSVC